MAAIAEFENVEKAYGGQRALGPLTLTIPEGTVGLLGPNGAGKSTLVRLLLGLMKPTSGTLRVLGEDVTPGNRSLRRRIGYVPEGEALFPDLTGVEAVAYAGRLVGMGHADAIQRTHQVLDYVDLGEARYRLVQNYSTGMRQRLKLAQALVHDPDLLILDEPTEGVDPEARSKILELIHELAKEYHIQLLLSTHILPDVERLASHVVLLNKGQVAVNAPLADVRASSAKGFVVRVAGPTKTLTERLSAAGVGWRHAGASVHVDVDDPHEVLKLVKDAGLVVRHLAPWHVTLGEAFDRAVQEENHA